jgi:hypothetical protein
MTAHNTEEWSEAGLARLAQAVKPEPQFTPGPWAYGEPGFVRTACEMEYAVAVAYGEYGSSSIGSTTLANAALIAAAPDLLAELQNAHQIIKVMLSCMTIDQKLDAAEKVERLDLIGPSGGTTRFHEREDLIAKATGSAT